MKKLDKFNFQTDFNSKQLPRTAEILDVDYYIGGYGNIYFDVLYSYEDGDEELRNFHISSYKEIIDTYRDTITYPSVMDEEIYIKTLKIKSGNGYTNYYLFYEKELLADEIRELKIDSLLDT